MCNGFERVFTRLGHPRLVNANESLTRSISRYQHCALALNRITSNSRLLRRDGCAQNTFPQKYFIARQPVAKNTLAANNPVFRKPAILGRFMGHHPQISARAGPNVPPPQRRPGPSPSASVPSRLRIILILAGKGRRNRSPRLPDASSRITHYASRMIPQKHQKRPKYHFLRLVSWNAGKKSGQDRPCCALRAIGEVHFAGVARSLPEPKNRANAE